MPTFCAECDSLLQSTTANGELVHVCRCSARYKATAEDSLRAEEYLNTAESAEKYEVFIENSAHDTAGRKVPKECPGCGLDYMTMVYVGQAETVIYVCDCGEKFTNMEYKELMEGKGAAGKGKKPTAIKE